MSGYTTIWERRPSFDDDGQRRRQSATLDEARLIMQMAFMTEPDFRPIGIVDATGRSFDFVTADPLRSEQDYLDRGFEYYDEWQTQQAGAARVATAEDPPAGR